MIKERFVIKDFSEDLEEVKEFIGKVDANSDQAPDAKVEIDVPEDV
jgi:hypothetical protein